MTLLLIYSYQSQQPFWLPNEIARKFKREQKRVPQQVQSRIERIQKPFGQMVDHAPARNHPNDGHPGVVQLSKQRDIFDDCLQITGEFPLDILPLPQEQPGGHVEGI